MWEVVANGEEHLPKTADFGPGMDCSFTESECESEFEGLVYAYDSRQKECKLKYHTPGCATTPLCSFQGHVLRWVRLLRFLLPEHKCSSFAREIN